MSVDGTSSHDARLAGATRAATANWVIAIALSVIAVVLLLDRAPSLNAAFAQNALTGGRGIYAFTGQLDKNTNGLFMMDVDAGTVWVYEYLPLTRKLKLVAGRSFMYDRYLTNYNGEEPSPEMVEEMLRRQRAMTSPTASGSLPAGPASATGGPPPLDPRAGLSTPRMASPHGAAAPPKPAAATTGEPEEVEAGVP